MLVERRIAGIIRWLERLKKSYSSGAMESALMEAECAKADLEDLRLDVWSKVKPEAVNTRNIFSMVIGISRVAFISCLIVMLAVVPLAKETSISPVIEHDINEIVLAEPIIIVREEKKPEARPVTANTSPKKARKTSGTKRNTPAPSVQEKQPVRIASSPAVKSVPYDKVFSLMQTGQRALKNNSSVIKIK